MNILIIDNSIALTGAIRCAFNEAEMLKDKHKFTFVLPSRTTLAGNMEKQGYTVYYLPMVEVAKNLPALLKYIPSLLANAIRLHKIVKKEKIDIVQVNDFYNLLGVALKWLGYKGKLITYIRFLPSVMPAALKNIWIRLAHKYSNAVIGVSMAVINELPPNKLNTLIYDPVKFNETLPAKHLAPHDEVNILYVANYIRGKGQRYAIQAFASAYKQNKNIRLCFTGGDMGLQKNRMFKQELQQMVENLDVKHVVTFNGFSPSTEKEIKNADIALNFSLAESFSMTCLEAAYFGTSLIATRCGGPEEIIVDKQTGLLVPVKDTAAMCDAILTLANDAALRDTYAAAAQKYVRSRFSVENFVTQFEDMLTSINAVA